MDGIDRFNIVDNHDVVNHHVASRQFVRYKFVRCHGDATHDGGDNRAVYRPRGANQPVANRPPVHGQMVVVLRTGPDGRLPVVGTLDIEILVANHIPEHRTQFVQRQAWHPMRAVSPQANNAAGGDVGMKNG